MTEGKAANSVAGYVLAGGQSTRFGRDKALVEMAGKTMLARTSGLVSEVTGGVAVVAAPEKYGDLGYHILRDRWPGEGPLGGILTALMDAGFKAPRSGWCLVVGCDMPFLTAAWLNYLEDRALASTAEVVVPQSASGPEPLCACWRITAKPAIQAAFDAGVRKVTQAMRRLTMEILDEAQWKRFDSAGWLFWNMNTAADYEDACRYREINANE
jgi:molybdenum cofactor guanylyltransferase